MAGKKNHGDYPEADLWELRRSIDTWARELGFAQCGVSDIDLAEDEQRLLAWLGRDYHGEMTYMARHGTLRARPAELLPGTLRVLSLRMNYLPLAQQQLLDGLGQPTRPTISCYALGRDYHKLIRRRLQKLAERIKTAVPSLSCRVFTDSAPVLEKPLAGLAGLGWIGKHSNLINRDEGSWFFLGEILIDLPLPIDKPASAHCGTCSACIEACPTDAIVEPFVLDARRCISYLTIEYRGSIPLEFREAIGNRIYGCDDCQLVCPWNRFAPRTDEDGFQPRPELASSSLCELFLWNEEEFLSRTEGSAIRRIGHEMWLRNIAVALGNAPHTDKVVSALEQRRTHTSTLVREHVEWALKKLQG